MVRSSTWDYSQPSHTAYMGIHLAAPITEEDPGTPKSTTAQSPWVPRTQSWCDPRCFPGKHMALRGCHWPARALRGISCHEGPPAVHLRVWKAPGRHQATMNQSPSIYQPFIQPWINPPMVQRNQDSNSIHRCSEARSTGWRDGTVLIHWLKNPGLLVPWFILKNASITKIMARIVTNAWWPMDTMLFCSTMTTVLLLQTSETDDTVMTTFLLLSFWFQVVKELTKQISLGGADPSRLPPSCWTKKKRRLLILEGSDPPGKMVLSIYLEAVALQISLRQPFTMTKQPSLVIVVSHYPLLLRIYWTSSTVINQPSMNHPLTMFKHLSTSY